MGNLRSVEKAFEYLGAQVKVTSNPGDILNSDAVVLPGVGAFADCMDRLISTGLDKAVAGLIEQGKPYLGICLGLQVLFEKSYEGGENAGLGLIKGEIVRLPDEVKVPHIGWNQLDVKQENPLLKGIAGNPNVYFVHSYHATSKEDVVVATTDYGTDFTSFICKENIYGVQFHPEKSGKIGLKILGNFLEIIK